MDGRSPEVTVEKSSLAGSVRTSAPLEIVREFPDARALRMSPLEHDADVVAVVAEIAGKRAAHFGRAPVMTDVDVAIALLGYDGLVDDDFVALRSRLVHDAAHDYIRRRELVDAVPETLLPLRMAELIRSVDGWRSELLRTTAA